MCNLNNIIILLYPHIIVKNKIYRVLVASLFTLGVIYVSLNMYELKWEE